MLNQDRDVSPSEKLGAVLAYTDSAALWLTRRKAWQAWAIVLGWILATTSIDLSPLGNAANIRALYVVPVMLACWMFRSFTAVVVTAAIIMTLFVKPALYYGVPDFGSLAVSAIARTLAYSSVAVFVLSLRRVYDQALALAQRDQMTGALNKTAFENEAAAMLLKGRTVETTLLFAIIDLDGFKQLNDNCGHASGDEMLRAFSRGLLTQIRRDDRLGRIGGDEFALLLRAESEQDAYDLAIQLHGRTTEVLARTGHAVTCSMGALIVPPAFNPEPDVLMREADRLMYIAKRNGKNRVHVSAYHPVDHAGDSDRSDTRHPSYLHDTVSGARPASPLLLRPR